MSAEFVLSVRDGRDLRSEVRVTRGRPLGGHTWLIFVHGFGVAPAKADTQWQRLRSMLALDRPVGRVQTGQFLWPSRRTYPATTAIAQRAGRILGAYLVHRADIDVVLIGHSLGARVSLAAADRMRGARTLRGFALLGAAVQVTDMEPGGPFDVVPLARREAVAHCARDGVLLRWFRPGERLASPLQQVADAVGLQGQPVDRGWQLYPTTETHHEYWRIDASVPATRWAMDTAQPEPIERRRAADRHVVDRIPFGDDGADS